MAIGDSHGNSRFVHAAIERAARLRDRVNVATVIAQFVEDEIIDPAVLAKEAAGYPTAVAQRAGFLTESMADLVDTSLDLRELEQLTQGSESVPLASHRSDDGDRDNRWGVIVNTEIEPDL